MTQPNQPVGPTPTVVTPGQIVTYTPQNPFSDTATWGLIVMVIAWAVNRWVPADFRNQALLAALEIAGFFVAAGVTLYGRWKAHRPLSLSNRPQIVRVK